MQKLLIVFLAACMGCSSAAVTPSDEKVGAEPVQRKTLTKENVTIDFSEVDQEWADAIAESLIKLPKVKEWPFTREPVPTTVSLGEKFGSDTVQAGKVPSVVLELPSPSLVKVWTEHWGTLDKEAMSKAARYFFALALIREAAPKNVEPALAPLHEGAAYYFTEGLNRNERKLAKALVSDGTGPKKFSDFEKVSDPTQRRLFQGSFVSYLDKSFDRKTVLGILKKAKLSEVQRLLGTYEADLFTSWTSFAIKKGARN